jgi:hypothetical protein
MYGFILHAAAELPELLHDVVSDTDPVVHIHLGPFLKGSPPEGGTGDSGMDATVLLNELTEAADLLQHLLARPMRKQKPHAKVRLSKQDSPMVGHSATIAGNRADVPGFRRLPPRMCGSHMKAEQNVHGEGRLYVEEVEV